MERDGMKRGSATNHLNRSDTVKVMMMVLPSSAVKLIHLGSQLKLDFSSVSSAMVMESVELAGVSLLVSQSIKTVSSSCTWLLRETEVPLHQEDWKKEHGKRFMPCTNEYLENPIMLDLSDLSELAVVDWEGKQVEKDLVGRLLEFENAGEKEDFDPPEAEGVWVRL